MDAKVEEQFFHLLNDPAWGQLVDMRVLGTPAAENPGTINNSGQRGSMFGQHAGQAVPINEPTAPNWYSGTEYDVGRYVLNHNAIWRDEAVTILAVARKGQNIGYVPLTTIIAVGEETRKVHVIHVRGFTYLSKSVKSMQGFENRVSNMHLLRQGARIPPDVVFSAPRTHDGYRFMRGRDLNVCLLAITEDTEDATVFSQTAARQCGIDTLRRLIIPVSPDRIPLNLYGVQGGAYQCLPRLGDNILSMLKNGNTALFASRASNTATAVADLNDADLCTTRAGDFTVSVLAHERLVDVDVISRPLRETPLIGEMYGQINDWREMTMSYWRDIVNSFMTVTADTSILRTPEYDKLVAHALQQLVIMGDPFTTRIKNLMSLKRSQEVRGFGSTPVEYVQLQLTLCGMRELTPGDKNSDRNGTKGTIAAVWPDEMMPVDESGLRADVIINTPAVINRMNPSSQVEELINRTAYLIAKEKLPVLKATQGYQAAYDYIRGWFADIRPVLNVLLDKTYTTPGHVAEFIDQCIAEERVPVQWTAGYSRSADDLVDACRKWGYRIDKVWLSTMAVDVAPDGTKTWRVKRDLTEQPTLIARRYMIILNKPPESQLSAVSVGSVGGQGQPVASSGGSRRSPDAAIMSDNNVRFPGEDETRNLLANVEPAAVARYIGLHGNSPHGVQVQVKTILEAERPSAINDVPITNKELNETNVAHSLLRVALLTQGVRVFKPQTRADFNAGVEAVHGMPAIQEDSKREKEE